SDFTQTHLAYTTFAGNGASEGGAIGSDLTSGAATGDIFASVIGANGGAAGNNNCSHTLFIIPTGFNVDLGHTCNFSPADHDLTDTDPLLGALANNGGPTLTMALQTGSPAIDLVNPVATITIVGARADLVQSCISQDQRGVSRPLDGNGDG